MNSTQNATGSICVSVVSHRQAGLLAPLLDDLVATGACASIRQLTLTENLPEPACRVPEELEMRVRRNLKPLGFARNHNDALEACDAPFLAVLNPDIRLENDPFPALLAAMQRDPRIGVIAPTVLDPRRRPEDNARHFPTPWSLVRKACGVDDGRYRHTMQGPASVDWVAGMFLLIRTEAFRALGGFDDRFYLYYEDVDFCARLWKAGWNVQVHPEVSVIHDARRASRHNPRYMVWHAASMARYFAKHLGRLRHAPA
jgi:N-acetylglucosaminyl-diphospho-decaprenol L-rhamnosyltransferase